MSGETKIFWYILFVKTGYEEKIINFLNLKFNASESRAFVPKKEVFFRRNGIDNVILEKLFPGYVFIETTKTYKELLNEIGYFIRELNGVYKFLCYDDKKDVAIHEDEKNEIIAMCGEGPDWCFRSSVGVIIGDKVKIISGALMGREVIIKKLNRHKRQAIIEMVLFGEMREISVALEIIRKI